MTVKQLKPAGETLAARVERTAQMTYLTGAGEVEVAGELGIKPTTLRDWKRRPEWGRAVAALREAQNQLVADRLALMTEQAVGALEQSLASPNPTVRLKAAVWVLERAELGVVAEVPSAFELHVRGTAGRGA